jgi:hypothetical protein
MCILGFLRFPSTFKKKRTSEQQRESSKQSGEECNAIQCSAEQCNAMQCERAVVLPWWLLSDPSLPPSLPFSLRRKGESTVMLVFAALVNVFLLLLGLVAGSTPEGMEYLRANALKEGVTTTASGLQYRVIASGDKDGPSPLVSTPCSCHYSGKLIDGTEFDSSFKRGQPTTFAPNQGMRFL